jgi:hypothetical protein
VGGERCVRGADCEFAGDEVLFAVLHSRDAAGVFHISRHRVWVEVFAEREEGVGVSGGSGAGVGLCDEGDVGAEFGAMGVGLGLALLWSRRELRSQNSELKTQNSELGRRFAWKVWLGAAIVGVVVAGVLFSGLFTNWRGVVDAVKTYFTYVERGTGKGEHDKPFGYYISMLSYYRYGRGRFIVRFLFLGWRRLGW